MRITPFSHMFNLLFNRLIRVNCSLRPLRILALKQCCDNFVRSSTEQAHHDARANLISCIIHYIKISDLEALPHDYYSFIYRNLLMMKSALVDAVHVDEDHNKTLAVIDCFLEMKSNLIDNEYSPNLHYVDVHLINKLSKSTKAYKGLIDKLKTGSLSNQHLSKTEMYQAIAQFEEVFAYTLEIGLYS